VTVCLVEAGPTDVGNDDILPLTKWMHLLDSGYDWDYPVEPQANGNSFMRHARAKVLGGCSSHNSCIAFHPPAESLDEWVEMGATGWGSAEILPLVRHLETNDAPGDHGHDGPVRLQDVPPVDPCGIAVLEAAALAGLPTVAFNRGETVRNGAGWFQINVGADGTRMSTSHAYLHPILDSRKNLEVRTGCWVSEILFDDTNAATGVRYQRPDLTGYDTVSARREVIVTAGSIDTPKLLMLSGIGPADHLREMGITVRVDSPGVGSNLDDHVEGIVQWDNIINKVLIPMVASPLVGFAAAFLLMLSFMWIFKRRNPHVLNRNFRMLQVFSAAALALGHGLQDAQKTMGVILLALVTYQPTQYSLDHLPLWVVLAAAGAISAGTYAGGWRIMRTLGRKIIKLDPPSGFAAETVATGVLYVMAIHNHAPISTTHTITSAIMGVGATKRLSAVRWSVAGNIVGAWFLTFPGAALVAVLTWWVTSVFR
jgi:hypothetical protein